MKLGTTLFLVAGLAALSACGGGAETNTATNTAADELYNVPADDLGAENLLGNEADANLAVDANLVVDANVATESTANGL